NPGIAVRTNARLREEVLTIFRQTFSITYALKGIGVAVAVTGLALALIGLMLERKRELTTLKALGMSRVEIARATAVEGLGIALVGSVGGLALSLALGRLLIFVINKQSFGWTLAFQVPVGQLAALGGLILLTSAVVAYAAGYWGANLPADKEE
ncbi:MAG: putative ABC transport system permease protein, partial [Candidatus Binatia bacterium]